MQIIRILHGYEVHGSYMGVRLCRVMQNSGPEGLNFLSALSTPIWFCFLHTFRFWMFYFKSRIHYQIQWRWRKTFLNLTSMWRCNDVNLMTKLCDVLYNQCKPNSHENFLFCPSHGWDNFYPKQKPRIYLSYMQECIFWFFGINELILGCSECTVLLKDLLGGVRHVALTITAH